MNQSILKFVFKLENSATESQIKKNDDVMLKFMEMNTCGARNEDDLLLYPNSVHVKGLGSCGTQATCSLQANLPVNCRVENRSISP